MACSKSTMTSRPFVLQALIVSEHEQISSGVVSSDFVISSNLDLDHHHRDRDTLPVATIEFYRRAIPGRLRRRPAVLPKQGEIHAAGIDRS